jgi:hypothetical protein
MHSQPPALAASQLALGAMAAILGSTFKAFAVSSSIFGTLSLLLSQLRGCAALFNLNDFSIQQTHL